MILLILPLFFLGLLTLIFSAGWALLIFGLVVLACFISVLLEPVK